MALSPLPSRRTLELIRDESVKALQAAERAAREEFNQARLFASLGVGLALVGFLLVAQWRGYGNLERTPEARSDRDLALVVQEMNAENNAMRSEALELEMGLAEARDDAEGRERLVEAASKELEQLRVIAGLVEVEGAGVTVRVADPDGLVMPDDVFALVNDLKAGGAEAVAIGGVRVGSRTSFTGGPEGLYVDGRVMREPYIVEAIGSSAELVQAIELPGGVEARFEAYPGVSVSAERTEDLVIPAGAPAGFTEGKPVYRRSGQ